MLSRDWTRRDVLKTAAAGGLVSALESVDVAGPTPVPRRSRPHPPRKRAAGHARLDDDQRPHRSQDQVPHARGSRAMRREPACGRGNRSRFTSAPTRRRRSCSRSIAWVITRAMAGALKMKLGPLKGTVQPDPPIGPKRLRECGWEPSATIKIPDDWTSGVYLGKLTAEREKLQSYVVFVVRDDRKATSSSRSPTRPGTPTTAGPASFRCTTTARKSGTGARTSRPASTGPTASTARSWTRPCRSARASFCCGSFRWPTGWNSRATT